MMYVRTLCVLGALAVASCAGGGGYGGGGGGGGPPPPGAKLSSLAPTSTTAGGPPFTLTVNGSNFVAGGTLTWNGQTLGAYQLVSSTQITIVIGASLIATPGSVSIGVVSPGVMASNALSLTVNPFTTSACLLFGSYDFFFTGFNNNGPVTIAGNFGVDASGQVTGEQDFKDLKSTNAAQPITGGSCTNAMTANEGTLTLTTSTGTFSYAFAAQTLPVSGTKGRLSAASGLNGLSGSGRFNFTPGGFFLGDYVLGVVGSNSSGGRMGVLGRFTDTTPGAGTPGTLSNGLGDINNGGTLSASLAITGTVGVPDVYSRSAATLTVGTQALQMAFYVINSSLAFVVNADSAAAAPLLAGFANTQASYGMLNNGNLSMPIIVSTWGAVPGGPPASATLLARASNFNAGAGTFDLLLDEVAGGVANANQSITGATYSIASTGRGTAAFTVGATPHSYVLYLDAFNDGYLLDTSPNVAFGFFSVQAAGPFNTASINGTFAAGTWFSPVATSPNATGVLTLNNGAVSGLGSGSYAVDASGLGRGTATINSVPLLGSADQVFYIIGPNALEIMGSDPVTNDAIAFMNR
jgi:hypothetical protein